MSNKTDIEDRLKNLIKELRIDTVISFRIAAESRKGLADDLEYVLTELETLEKEKK